MGVYKGLVGSLWVWGFRPSGLKDLGGFGPKP